MDYTRRAQMFSARSMAEFRRQNADVLEKTQDFSSYLEQRNGPMPIIVEYKEVYPLISNTDTIPPNPCITTVAQVFTALESMMVYNASRSFPPTKSAREYYLWSFTVASAYSWVTSSQHISGTKDSWNWDIKNIVDSDNDVFVWMTHILVAVMSNFVPSYDTSTLLHNEQMNFNWTDQQQTDEWARVSAKGNYSTWLSAWNTWYTNRGNDGSITASLAPSDSVLPNGSTRLNVSVSQDISAYTSPQEWTPLIVNGAVKNFLTYGWGDVTSTCLSAQDETDAKNTASTHFLGTSAARDTEIDDLKTVTSALTDAQKVSAEFWAGGPTTVSPPCMMLWFWKKYIEITGQGMNRMIYSGLELSINIFESSRLTWALKRDKMEARPIQEFRRRYAAETLTKYDGTSISGSLWVPYQETNFVTPPFADFPSGHSTFSQSFANVMSAWFGNIIPTNDIVMSDLNLLSPIFSGTYVNKLTNIMVPARSSRIEATVPSTDINMTWTTWQEIADSAGISRQYGGIHCVSANSGGQSVANSIFPLIHSSWAIYRG